MPASTSTSFLYQFAPCGFLAELEVIFHGPKHQTYSAAVGGISVWLVCEI